MENSSDATRQNVFRWSVGQSIEFLDTNDVYCPAVVHAIDKKKQTMKIRYIGWGEEWDETVKSKDFNRIQDGNAYTRLCKCWVRFSINFAFWPAVVYVRKPLHDSQRGIEYLKEEKKVYVIPYGPMASPLRPYKHGVWILASHIVPLAVYKDAKIKAGLSCSRYSSPFQDALVEMNKDKKSLEISFHFNNGGSYDIYDELQKQALERHLAKEEAIRLKKLEKDLLLQKKQELLDQKSAAKLEKSDNIVEVVQLSLPDAHENEVTVKDTESHQRPRKLAMSRNLSIEASRAIVMGAVIDCFIGSNICLLNSGSSTSHVLSSLFSTGDTYRCDNNNSSNNNNHNSNNSNNSNECNTDSKNRLLIANASGSPLSLSNKYRGLDATECNNLLNDSSNGNGNAYISNSHVANGYNESVFETAIICNYPKNSQSLKTIRSSFSIYKLNSRLQFNSLTQSFENSGNNKNNNNHNNNDNMNNYRNNSTTNNDNNNDISGNILSCSTSASSNNNNSQYFKASSLSSPVALEDRLIAYPLYLLDTSTSKNDDDIVSDSLISAEHRLDRLNNSNNDGINNSSSLLPTRNINNSNDNNNNDISVSSPRKRKIDNSSNNCNYARSTKSPIVEFSSTLLHSLEKDAATSLQVELGLIRPVRSVRERGGNFRYVNGVEDSITARVREIAETEGAQPLRSSSSSSSNSSNNNSSSNSSSSKAINEISAAALKNIKQSKQPVHPSKNDHILKDKEDNSIKPQQQQQLIINKRKRKYRNGGDREDESSKAEINYFNHLVDKWQIVIPSYTDIISMLINYTGVSLQKDFLKNDNRLLSTNLQSLSSSKAASAPTSTSSTLSFSSSLSCTSFKLDSIIKDTMLSISKSDAANFLRFIAFISKPIMEPYSFLRLNKLLNIYPKYMRKRRILTSEQSFAPENDDNDNSYVDSISIDKKKDARKKKRKKKNTMSQDSSKIKSPIAVNGNKLRPTQVATSKTSKDSSIKTSFSNHSSATKMSTTTLNVKKLKKRRKWGSCKAYSKL